MGKTFCVCLLVNGKRTWLAARLKVEMRDKGTARL